LNSGIYNFQIVNSTSNCTFVTNTTIEIQSNCVASDELYNGINVQFSLSCGNSGIPNWEIAISVIIPVVVIGVTLLLLFHPNIRRQITPFKFRRNFQATEF